MATSSSHNAPLALGILLLATTLLAVTAGATSGFRLMQPLLGSSKSKLSIHTSFDGGSESWKFVNNAHPRVIKLFDNFSVASQLKQAVPSIIIVGRIFLPNQPQNIDPTQAAQQWFNNNKANIMANRDVDYWEGYNEPSVGSTQDMQWLAAFEAARVNLLATIGARASIGNFATGTPDITNLDLVNAFAPAIDAARNNSGILGVHEYNSPDLANCFDNSTQQGWMTGRYRQWYQKLLIPQNRSLPLVISETGIDNSPCTQPASPNLGGWRKYCDWWSQHGYGDDCPGTYVNMLAWYDSILRADSYVLGATIFSLEISGWDDYDISGPANDKLIAYMNSLGRSPP